MKTFVEDAKQPGIVDDLVANARAEDVREWERGLDMPFEPAFRANVVADLHSRAIIDWKGRCLCVFGGVPMEDHLQVWLVATNLASGLMLSMHQHLKRQIDFLHTRSRKLVAHADADNEKHHEWLKWLGFKVKGESIIHGHKFITYVRTR